MRALALLASFVFSPPLWGSTILERQLACPKFPVRLAIAVDVSGSNQLTDANGHRKQALTQVITDLQTTFAKHQMNPMIQLHLVAADFEKRTRWQSLEKMIEAGLIEHANRAEGDNSQDFFRTMINSYRKLGDYEESEFLIVIQDYDTAKLHQFGERVKAESLNSPFIFSVVYQQSEDKRQLPPVNKEGARLNGTSAKLKSMMKEIDKFVATCLEAQAT